MVHTLYARLSLALIGLPDLKVDELDRLGAANKAQGGAEFSFTLPLPLAQL